MSRVHWLALTHIPGVGGARVRSLLEHFGSLEAVFAADPAELAALLAQLHFSEQAIAALRTISFEAVEAELAALVEEDITVLTWDDPKYPGSLRDLSDPPPVLFTRGSLLPKDEQAVAIVGSRQADDQAIATAHHLGKTLATLGLTVISGLALGVDTAAHESALEAKGRTLAVLGSGLKVIHPRENLELAERIVTSGALLSELRPEAPPRGPSLMARDRIIAALSRAVIVVEASENSGTLDTAKRARRLGRLVLACPGSPGTAALLKQDGVRRLDPQKTDLDDLARQLQ